MRSTSVATRAAISSVIAEVAKVTGASMSIEVHSVSGKRSVQRSSPACADPGRAKVSNATSAAEMVSLT
jgi:hypothetical protein